MHFIGDFARYDFAACANIWERSRLIQVARVDPHGDTMTVLVEVYASPEDVQPPRRTPPIVQEYFEAPYGGGDALAEAEAWIMTCDRFDNLGPL